MKVERFDGLTRDEACIVHVALWKYGKICPSPSVSVLIEEVGQRIDKGEA